MVLSSLNFKYHKLMNYLFEEQLMGYITLLLKFNYSKVRLLIQICIEHKRMFNFKYCFDQ